MLHRAGILESAQLQAQKLGQSDAPGHFGQLDLHRLGGRDRATKQDALTGIVDGLAPAGLGGADRAPTDAIAGLGQATQWTLQALDLGQAVGIGDAHIVQIQGRSHRGAQAHLVLDFLGRETGGVGRHDKALHTLIGLRPDDRDLGQIAVGDPHLGAIDDPIPAITAGVGLHVGRIGATMWFGQAKAADDFASGHARQPFAFLLLAAIGKDRIHAQRALHRDKAAQARIAPFQFLADQAVADVVQPGATVVFRQGRTKQAQGRDLGHQLLGKPPFIKTGTDDRHHLFIGKPRHRILDGTLLLGKLGADIEKVGTVQGHGNQLDTDGKKGRKHSTQQPAIVSVQPEPAGCPDRP